MIKSLITMLVVAIAFLMLMAQGNSQTDYQRFGIFGSYNIYQHRADFKTLPGVMYVEKR